MGEYHQDAMCGSCGGPLECHRDAICETCYPEAQWWAEIAALANRNGDSRESLNQGGD